MPKTLEFFFDYVSPYSYIARTAVKDTIRTTGAQLQIRPMFLGGVMHATGNRPPGTVPAKGKYLNADLERYCRKYGLTLHSNPHFPMNTRGLTRATIGLADDPARQDRFIDTCFRICWNDPRGIDPADAGALAEALAEDGFDPTEIAALADADANKQALKANTDEAVARGAFGAPTFFVGDQMFFGQDRLDFVAEALNG